MVLVRFLFATSTLFYALAAAHPFEGTWKANIAKSK